MVDGTAIETLKPALRGQLITPDDSNYDEARHNLFNAMIDKKPALIARCANVADVMTSVNFARENGLAAAIRGGGGNFGVVTSFEFRLHDISMAYAGPVFYPIEKTKEVLRFYREFIKTHRPN